MVEKAKKRLAVLKHERACRKQNPSQGRKVGGLGLDEKRLLAEFLLVRRALNRGRFMVPLDGEGGVFERLSARDYYRLVDWTGRHLRKGKSGVISEEVRPLLESLDLDAEEWLDTVRTYRKRFGLVAGTLDQMRTSAQRVGQKWWKGIRGVEKAFRKAAPIEALA